MESEGAEMALLDGSRWRGRRVNVSSMVGGSEGGTVSGRIGDKSAVCRLKATWRSDRKTRYESVDTR